MHPFCLFSVLETLSMNLKVTHIVTELPGTALALGEGSLDRMGGWRQIRPQSFCAAFSLSETVWESDSWHCGGSRALPSLASPTGPSNSALLLWGSRTTAMLAKCRHQLGFPPVDRSEALGGAGCSPPVLQQLPRQERCYWLD